MTRFPKTDSKTRISHTATGEVSNKFDFLFILLEFTDYHSATVYVAVNGSVVKITDHLLLQARVSLKWIYLDNIVSRELVRHFLCRVVFIYFCLFVL